MMVTVETFCVVDVRENEPESATNNGQTQSIISTNFNSLASQFGGEDSNNVYTPAVQLQQLAPPGSASGLRRQVSKVSPAQNKKKKKSMLRDSAPGNENDYNLDGNSKLHRKKVILPWIFFALIITLTAYVYVCFI